MILERIAKAAEAGQEVHDWHIQNEPLRNHRHLREAVENIAKLKSKAANLIKELDAIEDVIIRKNFEHGEAPPQKMDITVLKEAFRRFKDEA